MSIHSKSRDGENTGYINLYFHPNKRLFLDTIYCYDKFRGRGIASKLSNLAEYILKDYDGYIIRGDYNPSQLSTDRENNIKCSKEELEGLANNFYRSNGYRVITYDEYLKNATSYEEISIRDDFQLGEDISNKIVMKKLKTKESYNFYDSNGEIFEKELNSKNYVDIKEQYIDV